MPVEVGAGEPELGDRAGDEGIGRIPLDGRAPSLSLKMMTSALGKRGPKVSKEMGIQSVSNWAMRAFPLSGSTAGR